MLGRHDVLTLIAFIGGFSAATAMVIVACVALSIMISNDIVIPLFLRRLLTSRPAEGEDWSALILNVRRISIFVILFAAFLYYRQSTGNARLASIGLLSFAAIAQFAPSFFGGLMWRGANARGAALGMTAGLITWFYTLLFPSLASPDNAVVLHGLFGFAALKPQGLFGTVAEPLNHGVLWSLSINSLFFVFGSLSRAALPLERIQASIFAPRDAAPVPSLRRFRTTVTVDDLKDAIGRYLGVERTERSFQSFQKSTGAKLGGSETASMDVVRFSEQLLASAIGLLVSPADPVPAVETQRQQRPQCLPAARRCHRSAAAQSRPPANRPRPDGARHHRLRQRSSADVLEPAVSRPLFPARELGQVGVSVDQILRLLVERGEIAPVTQTAALNRLTRFGEAWPMELKRSGRIIEMRSNPMPDGGIVATYADISARVASDVALKHANESLEQRVRDRTVELTRVNEELAQAQAFAEEANLGKTRFLAAVGHDILQPLNAARLYSASLLEKASDTKFAGEADNIESSLESVETILSAVLDISRLDAGAMKPSELGVRDWRPAEADRNRLPPHGKGKAAATNHRAILAAAPHRSKPAAPPGAEPRLKRGEIHKEGPRPRRRPAARRIGRDTDP